MKNTVIGRCLTSLFVLVLACAGCVKDSDVVPEPQTRQMVITAGLGDQAVKTSINGTKVIWDLDDSVCVLTHNARLGAYRMSDPVKPTSIDGSKADFTVTTLVEYGPTHIFYPSERMGEYDSRSSAIKVDLPSESVAKKGDLPWKSNVSVGEVSSEGKSKMKNILGVIMFEITSPNVKEVRIEGNNEEILSGQMDLDLKTLSLTADSGIGSVSLVASDVCLEPGVYYLPIPPTEFSKGFSFKLKYDDASVGLMSVDAPISIVRNKIINFGKESEWNLARVYGELELYLFFNDRVGSASDYKSNWPFSDPTAGSGDMRGLLQDNKATLTYTQNNKNYNFTVYVQSPDANTAFRYTNGGGLNYGMTEGDYLEFPAIAGQKLTSVTVFGGGSWSAKITDTEGVEVSETQVASNKAEITYQIANPKVGEAYRLVEVGSTVVTIRQLTLNYE